MLPGRIFAPGASAKAGRLLVDRVVARAAHEAIGPYPCHGLPPSAPAANYRRAGSEIGLAAGRRVLVRCRVKTQPDVRYATPVDAVTSEKLRKLRGLTVHALRVDIVGDFSLGPATSASSMCAGWVRWAWPARTRAS